MFTLLLNANKHNANKRKQTYSDFKSHCCQTNQHFPAIFTVDWPKKSNVQYSFIPGIYGAEIHGVTQASTSTAAAASLILQRGGSESYCEVRDLIFGLLCAAHLKLHHCTVSSFHCLWKQKDEWRWGDWVELLSQHLNHQVGFSKSGWNRRQKLLF